MRRYNERHTVAYLASSIAEDNSLRDGESIVKIAEGVKFPILLFNSNKKLFDPLQSQLVTLHENTYRVGHEFGGHFQNIVRQGGTQEYDLCGGRKVPIDVIDLVLKTLVEQFVCLVKYQHLDIPCPQTSPPYHIENTARSPRDDMLPVFKFPNVFANGSSTYASMTLDIHVIAQCEDDGLNLRCEFAGGRQDKCLRFSDGDIDGLENRDGKCGRFTSSRLRLRNNIPPLRYRQDGTLLNSRRLFKVWSSTLSIQMG
jgi:hypothetical protein